MDPVELNFKRAQQTYSYSTYTPSEVRQTILEPR
jgi:hypothetical protein